MELLKPKVLMVEDSAPLSAVYRAYLKHEAIELVSVMTGAAALAQLDVLAGFAEAGSTGAGAGERPGWVQALSAAEAAALLRAARQKCRMETTERITE